VLRDVCRRVEHVDTDAGGVVHFSRYASLLETAVLENLEGLGVGVRELGRDGLELAVSELRLNYFASARFYDRLRISLRVERVGGASCRVSGDVRNDEADPQALLASGTLVLCVVGAGGAATPLPRRMRQVLRDCLDGADR
jgi:acyl-CoA thioester hydrolase